MHRDKNDRVDETPTWLRGKDTRRTRPMPRRAFAVVTLVVLALVMSTVEVFAATTSQGPVTPDATQQASTTVASYQENSARIKYNGRWATASYSRYSGGKARVSTQRNAGATFSFTGKRVAWVGPVGPTRGAAKVYVDGRFVKTVSTYASRFVASKTLFSTSFATSGKHTLRIVVVGTAGHPAVAIDRFTVGAATTSSTPVVAPKTTGRTVTVASIPALLSTLDDDSVGQIIVKDGTYRVSPANQTASNSLWIAGRYADRKRAITVRAETVGGVTFDGGGASGFSGLAFQDGAHDQTWIGFNFANMRAVSSGIIEIAGYTPRRAPHHITLRYITIKSSCTGRATGASSSALDHGIYIANALGSGPNHLVFDDVSVDGRGGLASAFHFYHSSSGAPNAATMLVRRLRIVGTQQGLMLWDPTLRNITFDGVKISGALAYAVRYETVGSKGIQFKNITSTASGFKGFYSTQGAHPAGVTFSGNSFR